MISHSINLKQLEAFVAVIDLGTFRAAATHLGTTQPSISARISTLEDALGSTLMLRDAGSVRLTEAGERLLPKARAVLEAAIAVVEEAGRRDLIEGRLRIGVSELVAVTWAQDLMRALRAAYPAVNLELAVALARDLDRDLASGRLDLAIYNTPFDYAEATAIPLGECAYIWVAAPDLAGPLPSEPALGDLLDQTILTHGKPTAAVAEFESACAARGLSARQVVQSTSLTSTFQMALGGMGLALLPRALVAPALRDGALAEIPCDWHPEPLRFYARYDRTRASPMARQGATMACRLAQEDQDFLS